MHPGCIIVLHVAHGIIPYFLPVSPFLLFLFQKLLIIRFAQIRCFWETFSIRSLVLFQKLQSPVPFYKSEKSGQQKVNLTKNEFKILQILMENKGRLVSRDTLMTKLWETDDYIEENTLTVNIARLRKKLEKAGLDEFITTKVGGGYLIEVER